MAMILGTANAAVDVANCITGSAHIASSAWNTKSVKQLLQLMTAVYDIMLPNSRTQ